MKIIMILGFLLVFASRGCQNDYENDYILTQRGDTIYTKDVRASWMRFKSEADSTMNEADREIAKALQKLSKDKARNKLVLGSKILKAEQLLERLGEKQNKVQLFDEIDNLDEQQFIKMETYKKEYKELEAKLNKAIQKLQQPKHEK